MAEMTTLAATIYREYSTTVAPGFEGVTPGITARFEVFYDERFLRMMVGFTSLSLVNPEEALILTRPVRHTHVISSLRNLIDRSDYHNLQIVVRLLIGV
jgi:hypothetical protein